MSFIQICGLKSFRKKNKIRESMPKIIRTQNMHAGIIIKIIQKSKKCNQRKETFRSLAKIAASNPRNQRPVVVGEGEER